MGQRSAPRKQRVNLNLTPEQFVKLQQQARDQGRSLPNLIRRVVDLALTERAALKMKPPPGSSG